MFLYTYKQCEKRNSCRKNPRHHHTPANLQFTIYKSKQVKRIFHTGKIRGIIPHQPVYIKKIDHSVSEVISVIFLLSSVKCISLQAVATLKSSYSCECSFKVRENFTIIMKYNQSISDARRFYCVCVISKMINVCFLTVLLLHI